ncbi:hypothetical protein D3C71_1840470 [compost metagenome]
MRVLVSDNTIAAHFAVRVVVIALVIDLAFDGGLVSPSVLAGHPGHVGEEVFDHDLALEDGERAIDRRQLGNLQEGCLNSGRGEGAASMVVLNPRAVGILAHVFVRAI